MSQEFNEEELAQLATSGGGASLPPGSETNAIIDYYCRQHMWRHVTKAASEALAQRRGDERETKFWRAIGYAEEGSYTEAIRELEPLQNITELALATTAALINTHKLAKVKDKDALEKLKEKLKTLSKTSDDRSLVVAGRYFWHADKAKQARQCIEKVLTKSRRNIDALTILGWINLTSGNSRYERKCLTLFDTVIKLTNDKKDIGSLLGRARYHEKRAKYDKVLEDLNTIIVMWPDFRPAVVEKARILMIMNNWEESVATAHRVLRVDKDDIDALRLHVLYLLTRESRALTIASRLTDLTEALDRTEPKNHRLYYEISQLCARLTNRRRNLLQQTLALIERACKLDPVNSAYITEQGYQLMLLEEYQQASMCFNEASKLDEGNLHALHGRIKCKILQQNYKEAEQELEFLQEIQSSIGSNADLKFLDALLAWNKDHNEPKAIACLQDAITEHNNMLKNVAAGYEYFIAYNPEFVLEAVNQLMQHIGTEPMQPGDPPNQLLTISIKLLNELTELVPGLLGAQLLLSKVTFIAGEFDASERALVTCLKLEPQCAPAHIIQAQICLARENYKQCSQSLEQARSLDFEVRNTPVYHLLKSRLLEASGQTEEALKTLEAAMELPGVKRVHPKNPLPLQERISLFLELASIHAKLQHLPEATKIMSDARHEFKDTSESVRITIADADLAIKRRDFDTALNMLRTISQDSPHYTRAKMKMAEIYLSYRKNKKLYTACFTELAQTGNTVHSYLLLGEAFMKIQEPEKAIQAYEDALKLNPEDPILASRIGRALITTHDYARAVQYYETAAKGDPSKVYLFHELAQLYLSLKHYDQALRVVGNALALTAERKSPDGVEDIQSQMYDVTSHSIAADVHQGAGDIEGAKNSLTAAWSLQSNVLASLRAENPDAKREQRDIAASLCYHLAELYLQSKMEEKAIQFYNEALKYNDSHEKSRAALARLHLINNELDACQHQCVTLMRIDPNNREASMMLADLMFRKNEHEAATYHFQQLLEKNPTRYEALNKLIQLLRRAGRLSDAPRFLKLAEKFNPHASSAAGLHYCKGLYHWYTNDPREALIQFNYARKDGEWGRQAIMNMIEIYLNPDNMDLFQETAEAKGDNSDHIAAAEKLLKELTSMGEKSNKYIVLESYALMASKQKPRIEKALSNLMALATSDRDHVPSLLGMANAYMLLGQPPKARNQLKRISKMKLDPEYAQDFERAWLMLAEMYIQVSKFEFATELCKKTLSNNKSNAKAWEQLGMIMEKEQAYRDASDHYEHAWRFMNESSPSIGFKLAFNYLKAKRYVEAIDVCHKVLTQYPEYPKIRKEILEKARQALRP